MGDQTVLTLQVNADTANLGKFLDQLLQIKAAVTELGSTSTALAKLDVELAEAKTVAANLRLELDKLSVAQTKQTETSELASSALSRQKIQYAQLTGSISEVTKALVLQRDAAASVNAAYAAVPMMKVQQATGIGAQQAQSGLIAAEFEKQVGIKSKLLALDNERLIVMNEETVRLGRLAQARGLLTQAEVTALATGDTLLNLEREAAREKSLLTSREALRAGAYQAEIRAEEAVLTSREALRAGAYQAEIRAEEAARLATAAGRDAAAGEEAQTLATTKLNAAKREQVRLKAEAIALSNPEVKAILAENEALKQQAPAVAKASAANRELQGAIRGTAGALGGLWLSYGAILPMMAAFAAASTVKSSFTLGTAFAHEMTMIKAISEESIPLLETVQSQLLELSKETFGGPKEAAEGLKILVQAGYDAQEALIGLPAVIDLSVLGVMSIEASAETLQTTIHAFGLELNDASTIVDKIAKGAAISATSTAEMSRALERSSTVATEYNMTLDDQVTALAVVAQRHLVGERAGTAFTNMMREIAAPSAQGAAEMLRLGVSAYDTGGNLRSLQEIMFEFQAALKGMTSEERSAALKKIFDVRGLRMFIPLLEESSGLLTKYGRDIKTSAEFAAKAAQTLRTDVYGVMKTAGSSLEVSLNRAFLASEPQIRGIAESLKELAASKELEVFLKHTVEALVFLGRGLEAASKFAVENEEVTVSLVSSYAVFKAGSWLIGGISLFIDGLRKAKEAQVAFNLAARANPYIMLGSLAVGVGVFGYKAYQSLKEQEANAHQSSVVNITSAQMQASHTGAVSEVFPGGGTPEVGVISGHGAYAQQMQAERDVAARAGASSLKDALDLKKKAYKLDEDLRKDHYSQLESISSAQASAELLSDSAAISESLALKTQQYAEEKASLAKQTSELQGILEASKEKGETETEKAAAEELAELSNRAKLLESAQVTAVQTSGIQIQAATEAFRQEELERQLAAEESNIDLRAQALDHQVGMLQASYDLRLEDQETFLAKSNQLELAQLDLERDRLEERRKNVEDSQDPAKMSNPEYARQYAEQLREIDAEIKKNEALRKSTVELQSAREKILAQSFADAVRDETSALNSQLRIIDAQTAALGMSRRESELYVRSVEQSNNLAEERRRLELDNTPAAKIEERISLLRESNARLNAAEQEGYDRSREASIGARQALVDYADDATNAARNMGDVFGKTFDTLEDKIISFAETGKFSVKEMVDSILLDLGRIILRENVLGPMAASMAQAIGLGKSGGATSTASGSSFDFLSGLSTLNTLRSGISSTGAALDSLQAFTASGLESLGFGTVGSAAWATSAEQASMELGFGAGAPAAGEGAAGAAAQGSWSQAMPYLTAATSAFNAFTSFSEGNEIGGTAHTVATALALSGNLPAAIAVEVGNWLGEKFGLWGGQEEAQFSMSELSGYTPEKWQKGVGFSADGATGVPQGNAWYATVHDTYVGTINEVQRGFNVIVEDLRDKMSSEAWDVFSTALESKTFADAFTNNDRWNQSEAPEAIRSSVEAFSQNLTKGLNEALTEALPIIGRDLTQNNETFQNMSATVQEAILAAIDAPTFTADQLSSLTKFFDNVEEAITTARKPIKDILRDIGKTDFEKGLDDLSDQFDTLAQSANAARAQGLLSDEAYTTWMSELNTAASSQAQELIDQYITPVTDSWKEFMEDIAISDLAPVQSAEGLVNRYNELKVGAASGLSEDVSAFQSFVTSEFLPRAQDWFGRNPQSIEEGTWDLGNYQNIYDQVMRDIGSQTVNIAEVDISKMSNGFTNALAPLFAQYFGGSRGQTVIIQIDGRQLGQFMLNEVQNNTDLRVELQGAI